MTYKTIIATIEQLANYDFEALRDKFGNMTDERVREEYVAVVNGIKFLESCIGDVITEEAYFGLSESLRETEDYLAHYLAILHCREHGYDTFEG